MSPIKVYDLGEGGVNVDKNPTRTEDNETRKSQNATYDATKKRLGGLSKRPGLGRFNTSAMDGAVLGGIEAPYKNTAGAPAYGGGGGGLPGEPGGTGDSTLGGGVGPGDSISPDGGVAVGGSLLTGGTKRFGGARLILVGRYNQGVDGTGVGGTGWYLTSKGMANVAIPLYTSNYAPDSFVVAGETAVEAGPPAADTSANLIIGGSNEAAGRPMAIANGVLYYGATHDESAAVAPDQPTIRRMAADGSSDHMIVKIPINPFILAISTVPSSRCFVTAMQTEWGNGDAIYIAVHDEITSGASDGDYGRVFRLSGLDSGAYALHEIFNTMHSSASALFVNPAIPFVLANHHGRIWVGFERGTITAVDPGWTELVPGPDPTTYWTLSNTSFDATAKLRDVTSMESFIGNLYIGFAADGVAGFATIDELPGDPDGAYGVSLTASGGSAADGNYFVSMVVFNDELYASWWGNNNNAKIYKFDGASWTTQFSTSTAGTAVPYKLRVDDGVIYAFGKIGVAGAEHWLSSTDGTTWTDRDTEMELGSTHVPVDVFFGIDQ